MYRLVVTRAADLDLTEIVDYISAKLSNPSAALAFLDEVESRYEHLRSTPRMFPVCMDERLAQKGYRKVVAANYLMLFRVDEAAKMVYVLRIVYHRRNYINLL